MATTATTVADDSSESEAVQLLHNNNDEEEEDLRSNSEAELKDDTPKTNPSFVSQQIRNKEYTDEKGSKKIFSWIEEIVGSQFLRANNKDETASDDDVYYYASSSSSSSPAKSFSLLEFELGKDEPSEDDLLRSSMGEGMVIPLKVVYSLDGIRTSKNLLLRLPPYLIEYAEDMNSNLDADDPSALVTVHTHETYFYSKVYPDIKNFLEREGIQGELRLSIPSCYYVKHRSKYEFRRMPALMENVMEARTLLLLLDPKGEGFNELETIEDVDLEEGVAVMTEMAKLHAVTWAFQQRMGRGLAEIWQDLLCFADQDAIHEHVIEGSFSYFAKCYEDEEIPNRDLYQRLLSLKPKIERLLRETLYAAGPHIPATLLHMMVGGPNLFFRRKFNASKEMSSSSSSRRSEGGKTGRDNSTTSSTVAECCISNWGLSTIGNPILDIALFTCVSLVPEVRARCTGLFLEHYWQTFESVAGLLNLVPKFDFQYILKEFEKFQVWGFLFMIAACNPDDMKEDEIQDILESILDIFPNFSAGHDHHENED